MKKNKNNTFLIYNILSRRIVLDPDLLIIVNAIL